MGSSVCIDHEIHACTFFVVELGTQFWQSSSVFLFIPELSFRFINQILFVFPNVHGEFKTRCLEIILSRVKVIPNLFLELKTKGFMNVLNHRYRTLFILDSSISPKQFSLGVQLRTISY